MCVRVLRVESMPFNVEVWADDGADCFTLYIDRELINERGALALQEILRSTINGWQRLDESFVFRALKAVTG